MEKGKIAVCVHLYCAKTSSMELPLISKCNAHVPGRKMNQDFFAKNLNKVTTALPKEEDGDDSNENNVSDTSGRSNSILQAIAELTQEEEFHVVNEIENDNPNECMNENLENDKRVNLKDIHLTAHTFQFYLSKVELH